MRCAEKKIYIINKNKTMKHAVWNNYKEIIKEWEKHPECEQLLDNYKYLKENHFNVKVAVDRIKEELILIIKPWA